MDLNTLKKGKFSNQQLILMMHDQKIDVIINLLEHVNWEKLSVKQKFSILKLVAGYNIHDNLCRKIDWEKISVEEVFEVFKQDGVFSMWFATSLANRLTNKQKIELLNIAKDTGTYSNVFCSTLKDSIVWEQVKLEDMFDFFYLFGCNVDIACELIKTSKLTNDQILQVAKDADGCFHVVLLAIETVQLSFLEMMELLKIYNNGFGKDAFGKVVDAISHKLEEELVAEKVIER